MEDYVDSSIEAEAIAYSELVEATELAAADPSVEESFEGKHVFISHKCDVEPDENIAWALHNDLTALGCSIYLDKTQPLGAPFDDEIKKSLRRADFVVALLTSAANESDWVTYELGYARKQFHQRGSPTILPIKLGSFEFSMAVGSAVGRSNIGLYDPRDYNKILEDVKAGIIKRSTSPPITPLGMEGFLVRDFRKNLTRTARLPSPELRRAVDALQKNKLLWIVGDDGVRNHFANCLAVEEHDREITGANEEKAGPPIYEIRSRNWSRVDATLVQKSIIIFPDVTLSFTSDQESTGTELDSLKNLVERNFVIITASEEAQSEIEQEMRNRGQAVGAHTIVDHNFYDEQAKLTMFEQLLDFSSRSIDISSNQLKWARRLIHEPEENKTFRPILNKWSPADIERFVMQHLRRAMRQGDVLKLLQRNARLDDEIHEWFIALDDSTRCFVLALSMVVGVRKEQLWEKYKLIIERLKKLDPNLALWPLGICRERAEPFVNGEGQLDFADERIRDAIYCEVTTNFREYLIELVPLIKDFSVPPGREQKLTREAFEARKPLVDETRELRIALARITGRAARQGLEGFTSLLDYWAVDPALQVREAVALTLEEAVKEQIGAQQALSLLQRWCNDRSNPNRHWTAASALGSIVAARPGRETYERALDLLERLASRSSPSLKFYLSIALKKAARKAPLNDSEAPVTLESVLKLVARDEKVATKINVAEALCEARITDEVSARRVIQNWISGPDVDWRWAGICSLLLWRRQKKEEWNHLVVHFLNHDAPTTASVLVEILNHKDQTILERFSQFLLGADETTHALLVSGCASLPRERLDEKLLKVIDPSVFEPFSIEVRSEGFRTLFESPAALLNAITAGLGKTKVRETGMALERLVQQEPRGHREEMFNAFLSAQADDPRAVRMLLQQFRAMGISYLNEFAYEFNLQSLANDLDDPDLFISRVSLAMQDHYERIEALRVLQVLSMPEPQGRCTALVRALGVSRLTRASEVDVLLDDLSWQTRSGFLSLRTKVKLFSFLSYVFSPRFASEMFGVER